MTFIYNPDIKDFELRSDGSSDRNDFCPCGSSKRWKECGALRTPEHIHNVLNMPDWASTKRAVLEEWRKLLKQVEEGQMPVATFAYRITGALLQYGNGKSESDEWSERVFDLAGPMEVRDDASLDDPDFKELQQLITKGF